MFSICFSLSLSLCLAFSLYVLFLSPSLPSPYFLFLCVCLSLSLSISPYVLFLSPSLSISFFLSLSLSLSFPSTCWHCVCSCLSCNSSWLCCCRWLCWWISLVPDVLRGVGVVGVSRDPADVPKTPSCSLSCWMAFCSFFLGPTLLS